MNSLIRLTDVQLILLTAAVRMGGWLAPPAEVGHGPARIRRETDALIRRGMAIEAAVDNNADAWRYDGGQAIGVAITALGREMIGLPVQAVAARRPDRPTKTAHVLQLLRQDEGVTLEELSLATGWQPHSGRAALTGLRKQGHPIVRAKRGAVSCYRIDRAA